MVATCVGIFCSYVTTFGSAVVVVLVGGVTTTTAAADAAAAIVVVAVVAAVAGVDDAGDADGFDGVTVDVDTCTFCGVAVCGGAVTYSAPGHLFVTYPS